MSCTSCGATNRDEALFCRNCGTSLQPNMPPPSVTEAPTTRLPNIPPVAEQPYQSPLSAQQNNPPNYTSYISPNMQAQNPPTNPGYANYQPPSYANYQPPLPKSASGRAIASLIISLLSIFTCPLLSILGMILGKMEINDIKQGRAPFAGMGIAKAGFWVGAIITAFAAFSFILWILFIAFSVFAG